MKISQGLLLSAVSIAGIGVSTISTAYAEQICRQECIGPVCQERCFEGERDRVIIDGRERFDERRERQERREERREERDRGPGLELRIPIPHSS